MTHDQITHHLNRWQKVMQAVDEKMSALCALTGDTDGPLPRAIGELQEKYTRLLTEHLGWDSDALQDWWLEHEFGASPMQAGFEGEGMREIRDNADLARFIHDDKARSSGMTECEKLRKDAEFGRSVLSKREPGKKYGCHCDIYEGMEPDGCVIDEGMPHHCIYAKHIQAKEQCEYWRVIASDAAMQEGSHDNR